MANLDTRNKRASAISYCLPFARVFPTADLAVSQGDRQQADLNYSGLLVVAAAILPTFAAPFRAIYIPLVKISFDSGDRYYSFAGVAAAQYYKDNLLSISETERSIDPISGKYQGSNCTLIFSNVDNEFSILKYSEAFKNREVQISIVNANDRDDETILVTLVVSEWDISSGKFKLVARDLTNENLQSEILRVNLDADNFSAIPTDLQAKAVPAIYGTVSSASNSVIGAVPGFLVTQSNPYTYIFADNISDVINVYLYGTLVDTANYTVADVVYAGVVFKTVQFTTDQRDSDKPNQFEITADVTGYDAGTYNQNPIEQLQKFLIDLGYETAATFPIDESPTSDSITKQEAKNYRGCIYAGESLKTAMDVLNQSAESFQISYFRTRAGNLAAYQFMADDAIDAEAAAEITDKNDIIRDSFEIQAIQSKNVITRLQRNYLYNWAWEYFEKQAYKDDPRAEDELNGSVVLQSFDQYCVRSSVVSDQVRCDRRYLQSEGVAFASFDLPIEFYYLDLNDWVSLTHYQGIGTAGYAGKMARIVSLSINLRPKSMRVSAEAIVLPLLTANDIAGCTCELDASILDADDADSIVSWTDISGNDRNAMQTDPDRQPAYDEDGCNDLPCIVFDGIIDCMSV